MNTLEKVEALREKASLSYEEAKNVLDEANGDLLDAIVILEKQGKIGKPAETVPSDEEETAVAEAEVTATDVDVTAAEAETSSDKEKVPAAEVEIPASSAEEKAPAAGPETSSDEEGDPAAEAEIPAPSDEEEIPATEKTPSSKSAAAAVDENASSITVSVSGKAEKKNGSGKKVRKTMEKIWNVLKNNSFHITRKESTLITLPAWAFALILLFTWKWMIPIMLISLFFQVRYSFDGKDDLSAANNFMDKAGNMAADVVREFDRNKN